MTLAMLVEMAADGGGDRVAVGRMEDGLTYAALLDRARRAGTWLAGRGAANAALVDVNSEAFPIMLFGAAIAGLPFAPVNYRWSDDQLRKALGRLAPAVVVVEDAVEARLKGIDGVEVLTRAAFLDAVDATEPEELFGDPDAPAVLLFTSGTSGDPKVAVLRHDNLTSYIFGTVEFMGADPADAQLVSVPPYHIAGIANLLSSIYGGRRIIQMPSFDPHEWIEIARSEGVTHAMVVPTMLARILEVLEADPGLTLPALRHVSYGGGRMPLPIIEAVVARLPNVGFVNAYGLTETSSTIAVLTPDDHREALASADPAVRRRLTSVGRPLPTVEVSIRDAEGSPLGAGEVGEVWVRGEQVSGEYLGIGSLRDGEGWFPTKDGGYMDADGYLFLEGRLDDVIIRGGENIAPGEVEDVLVAHPGVSDAAVFGVPDTEWGEAVVAVVVPVAGASLDEEELKDWVRGRLRSSKTPSRIAVRSELPYNDNGKLMRRQLKLEMASG